MAPRACCSSRVKAVRGTSSDTGRMATVDRLESGFPLSHLLLGVCRARLRPAAQKPSESDLHPTAGSEVVRLQKRPAVVISAALKVSFLCVCRSRLGYRNFSTVNTFNVIPADSEAKKSSPGLMCCSAVVKSLRDQRLSAAEQRGLGALR